MSNSERAFSDGELEEFLTSTFEREFDVVDEIVDVDAVAVGENPHIELKELNSAFARRIREFELVNIGYRHIEHFLLNAFELYQNEINKTMTI